MVSSGSAPRALLRRSLRCSHTARSLRSLASLRALLLLTAFLAIPLALASGPSPPAEAHQIEVADRTAAHWVSNATSTDNGTAAVAESLAPGEAARVHVAALMDRQEENLSALVWTIAISADNLTFETTNATLRKDYSGEFTTSEAFHFASFNFTAPDAAGTYAFSVNFTAFADRNGTLVELGSAISEGRVVVASTEAPIPPVGPGIPRTWLLAGLAVLVVGGIGGAVALRQRAIKRRMNEGPRRSQVMRELELEHKLEKAKAKDPEAAVVIQKEIRQAEQVREKRRELQILEAKRADALKTIDLLKKRHESGGLTKLQFDNMVAKKRADLERIEAEIAEMERQDGGAAA